jgi:hypothetical protein
MPYGRWVCDNGRQVLFSRRFVPLWQYDGSALPTRADPRERIKRIVETHFFYASGDTEAESRSAALAALQAWGLPAPDPSELVRAWHVIERDFAHARRAHVNQPIEFWHAGLPGHSVAVSAAHGVQL